MSTSETISLLEELGGDQGLRLVVDEFYDRLIKDDNLQIFFAGVSLKFLKGHQFGFMKKILLEASGDVARIQSTSADDSTKETTGEEDDSPKENTPKDGPSSVDRKDGPISVPKGVTGSVDPEDGPSSKDSSNSVPQKMETPIQRIARIHQRLFDQGANELHLDCFLGHWMDACHAKLAHPDPIILRNITNIVFGPFRAVFAENAKMARGKKAYLLARIGGTLALKQAVSEMMLRVIYDETLGPFFKGIDRRRIEQHQLKLFEIAFTTTGSGEATLKAMNFVEKNHESINKRLGIVGKHYDLMIIHFTAVLEELLVHEDVIHEVVHALEPLRTLFEKKTLAFCWALPRNSDIKTTRDASCSSVDEKISEYKFGGRPSTRICRQQSLQLQRQDSLKLHREGSFKLQREHSLKLHRKCSFKLRREQSVKLHQEESLKLQREPSLKLYREGSFTSPKLHRQESFKRQPLERGGSFRIQRSQSLKLQREEFFNLHSKQSSERRCSHQDKSLQRRISHSRIHTFHNTQTTTTTTTTTKELVSASFRAREACVKCPSTMTKAERQEGLIRRFSAARSHLTIAKKMPRRISPDANLKDTEIGKKLEGNHPHRHHQSRKCTVEQ